MIVVTGGAGFIGSNIVRGLNDNGEEDIIVVDNLSNATKHLNLNNLYIADYIDKDVFANNLSKFENIHAIAKKNYGIRALQIGDAFSRHWLARNQNPFLAEIDAVQKIAPHHGAYMLNLSYEWSCTSGAGPDPERPGNRMLRTLDWPMIGLGKNLVVIKRTGAAGPYWDITWPGFVGVITSMAPERFSGAINQPPMRKWSSFPRLDWILNKQKLWRQQTLPPSHLLRKTFDECQNSTNCSLVDSEDFLFYTYQSFKPSNYPYCGGFGNVNFQFQVIDSIGLSDLSDEIYLQIEPVEP